MTGLLAKLFTNDVIAKMKTDAYGASPTYFHETYPTCFLLWLVTSLHEIFQLSNLFQLFQESQISGQMNLETFWQFVLKLINYSWRSYPTRASYSGQVDGFRNPMKIELKTRPCFKRFHVDTLPRNSAGYTLFLFSSLVLGGLNLHSAICFAKQRVRPELTNS